MLKSLCRVESGRFFFFILSHAILTSNAIVHVAYYADIANESLDSARGDTMTYPLMRCTTRGCAYNIGRKRRKCGAGGWEAVVSRGGERRNRKRNKTQSAKPAGRCRAMTLRSVYGSDVDQLYAVYTRTYVCASLRNARIYLPTVTELHDRLIERFCVSLLNRNTILWHPAKVDEGW